MDKNLTEEEKRTLLTLARQALEKAVLTGDLEPLDLVSLPAILQKPGASFVTLTRKGELRGCIGALEPGLALAEDVRQHAAAAALQDYRFAPVRLEELPLIEIEISRLTLPKPLPYQNAEDLLNKINPGIDGVTISDGFRRATFLPQVWDKIPDKAEFLSHLCMKMGVPAETWKHKMLHVQVYQVEEFHEK